MAEQTFHQEFKGYWVEPNKNSIPKESGVYCVYTCTQVIGGISIQKLIYIGESDDVNKRIANHEKHLKWLEYLERGQQLCYSFTPVNATVRTRVEAAFIKRHQPPINIEYKNDFPFDKTIVNTSGRNYLLDDFFVINKTQ